MANAFKSKYSAQQIEALLDKVNSSDNTALVFVEELPRPYGAQGVLYVVIGVEVPYACFWDEETQDYISLINGEPDDYLVSAVYDDQTRTLTITPNSGNPVVVQIPKEHLSIDITDLTNQIFRLVDFSEPDENGFSRLESDGYTQRCIDEIYQRTVSNEINDLVNFAMVIDGVSVPSVAATCVHRGALGYFKVELIDGEEYRFRQIPTGAGENTQWLINRIGYAI